MDVLRGGVMGDMDGGMDMGGMSMMMGAWMLVGALLLLALLALAVVGIVSLVRRSGPTPANRVDTPAEILRRRYAEGDVDDEEYERRSRALER
jgi:putative membrane protein